MNFRIAPIVVLAIGGLLAAPAAAEDAARAERDAVHARAVMRGFASCVVHGAHDLARTYVLSPENRPLADHDYQRLADWRCLGSGRLVMKDDYFRGALAEVLIREDLKASEFGDFASVAPLTWVDPEPALVVNKRTGKPLDAAAMAFGQANYARAVLLRAVAPLGECVVRADPPHARAVLDAEVDTASELTAMKAMATTIAGCVGEGQTLSFNRTNLRNAIAISYYRLSDGRASAMIGANR